MKLRTIALAGVAVAALSASPALASTTGWYLGLGVGYDHLNPVHVTSTFPFSIDVDHSDNVIVVGSVVEMGENGGEPLVFYGGDYRRLDSDVGADRVRSARRCGRPGRVAR